MKRRSFLKVVGLAAVAPLAALAAPKQELRKAIIWRSEGVLFRVPWSQLRVGDLFSIISDPRDWAHLKTFRVEGEPNLNASGCIGFTGREANEAELALVYQLEGSKCLL